MSTLRFLNLAFLAIVASTLWVAEPAAARECRWFGTDPICRGHCPAGWEPQLFRGQPFKSKCSISGYHVSCCRVCGPAQYGTPGCPYPSFGPKAPSRPSVGPCGKGMYKGGDGQCYPLLK